MWGFAGEAILGVGTWRIRRWEACFPQPPAILQTGRDHLDLGRDVKGRLTAILKSGRNLQGSMLFVGTWPKSLSNSDVTQVSERSNGSGLRLSGDAGVLSTAGHNACGTTRPRVASDCLLSAPEQRTLTTIPSRDCKGGETEVRGARRTPPCLSVMEGNEARGSGWTRPACCNGEKLKPWGAGWTLPTRPARRGLETRGA